MGTVKVSEKVTQQLQQIAAQQGESLEALAERALLKFLREASRRAMRREVEAFKAQHATLFEQYAGRYIAMYQGQVVDDDEDQLTLLARIDAAYPDTPVLITPVLAESEETYMVYSPRWEDIA
jgi:predicted transcriptional regulator